MIHITLKDGSVKEFESGVSVIDVAKSLGAGLAKAACCGRINGEAVDLRTPITEDCQLEICTFDDEDGKKGILAHRCPCDGTGYPASVPGSQVRYRSCSGKRLVL